MTDCYDRRNALTIIKGNYLVDLGSGKWANMKSDSRSIAVSPRLTPTMKKKARNALSIFRVGLEFTTYAVGWAILEKNLL